MSNVECDYSFEMLYKAAFGKNFSVKEKNRFQGLNQREINKLVLIWAEKAKWETQKKIGANGQEFLAFYPKT